MEIRTAQHLSFYQSLLIASVVPLFCWLEFNYQHMETFASGMWFPAGMGNEQADVLCGGRAHAPISEIEVDVIIQDAETAINGTA